MLCRLEIKNFAVISHAIFEPTVGLNVISGETGAGKSLLIDAISLVMGCKASKNLIRSSEQYATVEAVFDLTDFFEKASKDDIAEFDSLIDGSGIEIEDNSLIIERKISIDGKSLSRINGKTVVLSLLRSLSSFLIDIHGQHETQKIFDEKSHIGLLDSFAGATVLSLQQEYTALLSQYKDIVVEMKSLGSSGANINNRKEYLSYAISEIEKAGFDVSEEKTLFEKKEQLTKSANVSEMMVSLNSSFNDEDDRGNTPLSRIEASMLTLEKLSNIDDSQKELYSRVNKTFYDVQALSADIERIAQAYDFDENELDRINDRIGLLYDLKAKYGDSVEKINEFLNNAREELDTLDSSEKRLSILRTKKASVEKDLIAKAKELSQARKAMSIKLKEEIEQELSDLCMPNAQFEVSFVPRPKEKFFSAKGTDDISFLLSPNPGESLKPLSAIISGGEASRVMLAIKNILSRADSISTLIFDEIDSGISGNASSAVASKLLSISKEHQVLCVTHTAQIAAASDSSFLLTKEVLGGSTNSYINALDDAGKESEVSRLLSGSTVSESIELARELIARYS